MLRGHVRREQIEHGFPTLALDDNVVQGFHNIFEKVVRETTERVYILCRESLYYEKNNFLLNFLLLLFFYAFLFSRRS